MAQLAQLAQRHSWIITNGAKARAGHETMAETFPKGGEILVAPSLCNSANLDTNIDYIKFHFNILQDSLDFDSKAVLD